MSFALLLLLVGGSITCNVWAMVRMLYTRELQVGALYFAMHDTMRVWRTEECCLIF